MLEGGIKPAGMVWGISDRRIRAMLSDNKFVSLSWLDNFCIVAATELWVTDFEWFTFAELTASGEWENVLPEHHKVVNVPKRDEGAEVVKPCKACGREVEGTGRTVFCTDDCYKWWNSHNRVKAI